MNPQSQMPRIGIPSFGLELGHGPFTAYGGMSQANSGIGVLPSLHPRPLLVILSERNDD